MARRRPRLPDSSYIGITCYFLTICCAGHSPVLDNDQLIEEVRTQFFRAAERTRFEILAYCFLPDHVHLLAQGMTEDSNLRTFVHRAKQFSGFMYAHRRTGRLWQRSYHDRAVRPHEDLRDIARYIVENPVRAGIVTTASDYPHAGSVIRTPQA